MARKSDKTPLNNAINAVNATLPNLQQGVEYNLEQLTGTKFWSALSRGKRSGLGIQFKAYVNEPGNPFPLAWAGATSAVMAPLIEMRDQDMETSISLRLYF